MARYAMLSLMDRWPAHSPLRGSSCQPGDFRVSSRPTVWTEPTQAMNLRTMWVGQVVRSFLASAERETVRITWEG